MYNSIFFLAATLSRDGSAAFLRLGFLIGTTMDHTLCNVCGYQQKCDNLSGGRGTVLSPNNKSPKDDLHGRIT